MKNIINKNNIFLTCCLTFVVMIGCRSTLDETIISEVTGDYYNTEQGLDDAINAAYEPLRFLYGTEAGTAIQGIFGTDEYTNGGHGGYHYLNQYTPELNSTANAVWNLWSNFYKGINNCNVILNRVNDIALKEDDKNNLVGQAKFLRAHYYFILVNHFGPITLKLDETKGVETEAIRDPENVVYDAIIDDLNDAISLLPNIQNDFGRATKPAAEDMLAHVLLTRGYKDFGEKEDFANAAKIAKRVIENYHFKLFDNPIDVFDPNNENNDEIIWSVQYTTDLLADGTGNMTHDFFGPWFSFYNGLVDSNKPGYGRPWIRFHPTDFGLNNFRPLDVDSRYKSEFQEVWYYNDEATVPSGSKVGDTAIIVTSEYVSKADYNSMLQRMPNLIYFSWNSNNMEDPWYTPINFFPWPEKKFSDYNRASDWATEGTRNYIVYRLSEIYLIAAEAYFQDGHPEIAVNYLNVIRERAAFEGKENQMKIDESDVNIDFILDERSRELFGEGHRWLDLVRTGKLIERVRKYNKDAGSNIQPYHVLRPIPANQILRTSNDYGQNDGY